MNVDLADRGWGDGLEGPDDDVWATLVIVLLLTLLCWPAKRVSGDAVRLGVSV